jgi:uncharacterized protein (DUF2336 family)
MPRIGIAMTMFAPLVAEIQDSATSNPTKRQLRALTSVTDLFMAGSGRHSKQQIEFFDEVFKTLVAVIELKTRIRLAHHVAMIPDAPGTLVRAFACDEHIAVAGPVLSESMALSESDLALSARTLGQDHLHAIAKRKTISEVITEILIERGGPSVVHTVVKNAGARISDNSFRELVIRGGDDAQLALHIGMRCDVPRHHFLKLLETASAAVCNKILATNPQLKDLVQNAVTDVVDGINVEVRSKSKAHNRAKLRIKRLKNWKDLGEPNVYVAARSQHFEQAVTALALLARCPIELAERGILNEDPSLLRIIARVAGCSWATVKALLLMRAADRRMSENDLDRERAKFARVEVRTAKRLLELYEARRDACAVSKPRKGSEIAVPLRA